MKTVRDLRSLRPLAFLLLAAAFALLTSCAGGPAASTTPTAAAAPSETHIVLFHSNDVHGRIDAMSKVAALLDAERKTGADVFYVSAGDNFTGDPDVDRFDPPGEPMLELNRRLGLAVLCPGNHEFDYGLDRTRKFAALFPMVSANIEDPKGIFPELRPSTVLKTRNGTSIVVFGLIQIEPTNGLPSTHPDRVKGLRFREPLARALELKGLRAQGQVLLALTHIGFDQDLLLARQMPEIDVIIGGHSHTRVDPPVVVNGVLVAQAGAQNLYLGRIDLRLRNGKVVEKKGLLIDLSQVREEDTTIRNLVARYRRNPAMTRVLTEAPLEITGTNALGSLMTDALRRVHGLDIAFQNNGGIRVGRLPKAITLRDAYKLDPFGNEVIEFVMTPEEIRGLIKSGFEKRGELDLQVSGITYIVRSDGGTKVREIVLRRPDGSALPEDRTYKVGLSSYIASTYGFAHQDSGRSLRTTTVDALIQFLEQGPNLAGYANVVRAFLEKPPAPDGN
jgi:5'-nucleotidase / UDP-sugar diphosphatase